jgi:glucokinase
LAISRAGERAVLDDPDSELARIAEGDPGHVTGELVTQAAKAGDPTSVAILAEVGRRLGEGIAGLVNVLDPDIVVVGGGAMDAGELLLGPARLRYAEAVEASEARPNVPIVAAELGMEAGAIGAATLALEELDA